MSLIPPLRPVGQPAGRHGAIRAFNHHTNMTTIHSNGSKWYGEEPDSIETLIEVLEREPLDPSFERYGGFIYAAGSERHSIIDPVLRREAREARIVCFFGNFKRVSHVFRIESNDRDVVLRLSRAIRANRRRPDYN